MVTTAGEPVENSRRYKLVAGFGLLAMAVLGAFANFGVFESIVVDDNMSETLTNIRDSEGVFRLGTLAFLIVAVLDVHVAWALN